MPRTALAVLSLFLLLPSAAVAQENQRRSQDPPPAPVVTAEVVADTVRSPLTLVGTAEPRYVAAVAAEGEGRVDALAARQGETVAKGAPLVSLRTTPTELRLQEARARREEIEARIAKARADAARAESLFAQGFISEQELQTSTTELATLRRQEDQVTAEIRLQEDQLRRLQVRAPFTGQVVEERTEVGQWLGEGDPVAVLADLSVMHVMVPVPEQHIGGIAPGQAAEVRFDAMPDQEFDGRVSAVVPRADPATRTFPVQISVTNRDGRILAGMLARVTFFLGDPRQALLLPKDALVPQPGGGGHIVKVDNGRAVLVPVRVEEAHGNRYAVEPLEGELAPGDRVVVRGNERLRPGQPVLETSPKSQVQSPKSNISPP